MKYFDFHTHAFVDSLAERAVGALAQTSDIKPYTDGTVRGLIEALDKNEIEKALLLPVATKPAQQKKKGWVCSVCGHVYEGEELPEDYVCPLCKHGRDDFHLISESEQK